MAITGAATHSAMTINVVRHGISGLCSSGRNRRIASPHTASDTAPTATSNNGRLYDSRILPTTSLV